MRVFLSATSLARAYGGPALSVLRLGEALQACGAEVGLWSADGSRPDHPSTLGILGGSLEQALHDFGDPDVVHDNGLWLRHNHRLATIGRRSGWPRFVSPRGMLEPWAMKHKRGKKWVAWTLYQKRDLDTADRLHATSTLEAVNMSRLGFRPPVDVIPNGIDLVDRPVVESAWASKSDRPSRRRAVFVGRLHPVKNLTALIDAWARAAPRHWELVLAGPDEDGHRALLENRIARLGLGQAVTLPGPVGVAEKRALLLSADLFVLPSFQESFGMAVGEALAHGLPSITTTGTPWEALPAERAGWRIAPTVDALTAALLEATGITDLERRAMGSAAYALVARSYSWTSVGEKVLQCYRATLAEGSRVS